MPTSVTFSFNDHQFVALAERALHWPAQNALIISDLHLGKGDIFRAAGIAVPTGGTLNDLERLTRLIETHDIKQLIIVGDIIHASRIKPKWLPTWLAFRAQHNDVAMHVILGNHDQHLDRDSLKIEAHNTMTIDGITFNHEVRGTAPQINGHIHPVAKVVGINGRWPVFWKDKNTITLPAFSLFTGGYLVDARDEWIACIEGEVLAHIRQN